jgi:ATP-dependent helicase/nuclease subunit B
MHEEVFRVLDQGATIVTATRRLSRVLTNASHSRQRALGRSTWSMPDVLPLDAFLERQWRDWVLRGAGDDCPRLLDPLQEQIVWEEIILESPAGETLLQISETARTALQAWQLILAYKAPVDGRFEATEDWSAFRDWSQTFRERCRANRWMERARLSDFLVERIAAGEISNSPLVYLAGFDDPTPQQAEFFETLNARPIAAATVHSPAIERCKAADATHEILAAAEWACSMLAQAPDTQIGVIVPDLKRLRLKVERIFRAVLDPAGEFGDRAQSFHVSLGPALGEYPIVRAALLLLELAVGPLSLPQAGVLLRSAFVGGAESERSARALLDAKLRKRGIWDVTVDGLREASGSCPILQRLLRRFDDELNQLPEKQSAQEWSQDFSRLLKALGWPGERPATSHEYQVLEAWESLLSNFCALDLTAPPMSSAQALSRLRDIAAHAPFQVENEGAPVQIMGMLEAAGLNFDGLWIVGLDDEALPAPSNPNPFLPVSLQREYNLPHSSAEKELEFSKNLMERLLGGAPQAVVSYSEMEGDRALKPSPLVPTGPWRALSRETPSMDWIARIQAGVSMEQLADDMAPPVTADGMQAGGSSLFKDMAACPFRAFAKHRLHAKPLEDARPGLTYKDRGTTVHQALELIWRELGSHARLTELSPDRLRELVARDVETAVNRLSFRSGRALERRRLETLLAEWLEIEKSRDPFVVSKTEDERLVTVNGLEVRTRADRVDELPDGRAIIVDYKTGRLNSTAWDGDRPDEPQLPLYCIGSERPIAGAAFAQIRTGELGFRGLTEEGVSLPSMRKMPGEHPGEFEEQVTQWKRVLSTLAEKFLAGLAHVDPKPGACDNCGLTALCRVRELQGDR